MLDQLPQAKSKKLQQPNHVLYICSRWYAASHILSTMMGAISVQWSSPRLDDLARDPPFASAGIVIALITSVQALLAVINKEFVSQSNRLYSMACVHL